MFTEITFAGKQMRRHKCGSAIALVATHSRMKIYFTRRLQGVWRRYICAAHNAIVSIIIVLYNIYRRVIRHVARCCARDKTAVARAG